MKEPVFGMAAMWIGVLSLGLAAIPPIVLEKPLPFFEDAFEKEAIDSETLEKRKNRDQTLKWFTVAAVSTALLGLALVPVAYVREDYRAFPVFGLIFASLAIFWQLILLGIAVAAMVFVILIIILHLVGSHWLPIKAG